MFLCCFQRLPDAAACCRQPLPRIARADSGLEHDQRRRQIVARLTQSVFRSGQAYARRFLQNPPLPLFPEPLSMSRLIVMLLLMAAVSSLSLGGNTFAADAPRQRLSMDFGWKFLLPVALANLVVTSFVVLVLNR